MTSEELYNNFKWKEFVVGDLFLLEKGKQLTKRTIKEGKIPYITCTGLNNGVGSYISNDMKLYKDALTVSETGEPGICFFHNYTFCGGGNTNILILKEDGITDNIGLFLASAIEKLKPKYSYGKTLGTTRLSEEIIYLPSKDGKPDYKIMEEYMILLDSEIIPEIGVPDLGKEEALLDSVDWDEFVVGDIFNVEGGKGVPCKNGEDGNYPYISATTKNNGQLGTCNNPRHSKNCITMASDGNGLGTCFYQENDFSGQSINVITLKGKKFNKSIAIFLCACLEKLKPNYSYGKKLGVARLKEEIIHLPTTDEGEINFKFMEEFMQSVSFYDIIKK